MSNQLPSHNPPDDERPKKRTPNSVRLEKHAKRQRVIQLREASVPVSVIAKSVGIPEKMVRQIMRDYYRHNADWAAMSANLRKNEKERQYERLDAEVQRLIQVDPRDKAAMAACGPGLTVRDWLAAVHTSVSIKDRLVKLHGLDGPTSAGEAGPGTAADSTQPDQMVNARVIGDWIDSLALSDPALHKMMLDHLYRADLNGPEGGLEEPDDDLPLSGGGRVQSTESGSGPSGVPTADQASGGDHPQASPGTSEPTDAGPVSDGLAGTGPAGSEV